MVTVCLCGKRVCKEFQKRIDLEWQKGEYSRALWKPLKKRMRASLYKKVKTN